MPRGRSRSRSPSRRHSRSTPDSRRDYDRNYFGSSRSYQASSSRYGGYSESDRENERRRDRERYDERRKRSESPAPPENKAKPNFKASGLLAAETNTVKTATGDSTVLKYNEPPEARKPLVGWRLYGFKGEEQTDLLHINRQSAYLFGRDRLVCDVPLDHPSCSKQHAVIQYRSVKEKDDYGAVKTVIKPFIIDLESTNGTIVNKEKIPTSRYYELMVRDVIQFGQSIKEYVLLSDEGS
ncbi:SMAD/FHA domain-containing protein [Flagelloscypha sp. PMI_526]|nr:SMAD/FHA domain-containing protein [Flagelloscypha sp. PMI_526]